MVIDVNRLVGFCLMIKREVIDAIGLLDERFGIGCFEDDDYCVSALLLRAPGCDRRRRLCAPLWKSNIRGRGIDGGALMRENQQRFVEKWSGNGAGPAPHPAFGRPLPGGARWEAVAARQGPGPFAVDIRRGWPAAAVGSRAAQAFACMIVRDEKTLPACLLSIRPWVDEMIIVDTGSVDETPRIVESFGGKLYQFPWCDDFSAARNESLRHAKGEWLFWMDSDDTIPPECGAACGRWWRTRMIRAWPPTSCKFTAREGRGVGSRGECDGRGPHKAVSQPAGIAVRRKDARTDSGRGPPDWRQCQLD